MHTTEVKVTYEEFFVIPLMVAIDLSLDRYVKDNKSDVLLSFEVLIENKTAMTNRTIFVEELCKYIEYDVSSLE